MKTKIIFSILVVLVVVNFSSNAQSNPDDIPKEFFKIFNSDPMRAIDYAFSTNSWMERNVDGVENLKNKFNNILPLIGDYYGYESITEKRITDILILKSYLIKFDRQPLRFTFVLYKPDGKWHVQNFNFDDNLDDELEESANQSNN